MVDVYHSVTLRHIIDHFADDRAETPFLIDPASGRVTTYGALRAGALALFARLAGLGLCKGDRVATLTDNGVAAVELFLGAMYGGFVPVPLNVRAGDQQLSYCLNHSGAKVVAVGQGYEGLIKGIVPAVSHGLEIISIEGGVPDVAIVDAHAAASLPPLTADDPAMIIYTSGSTGQPKGPVHTHGSILAHGRNSIAAHELTEADRCLLVLPLYHINAECVSVVPTLMSGGSMVVPNGFSVGAFWDLLDDWQCTWSAIVPTIISQLLDWNDPKAAKRAPAFERIRFLRSSSAPLSPSLHRAFMEKFGLLLIQAMGSSEGGNVFANPLPPRENKIGSPGLPWGFELRIVDAAGRQVGPDEPGEMLLRGPGLMQGYYKDPAATEEAIDADGWLHTGDLARRDADGYVFVVGRSKELIIKAGVNIAPKQIDEVLESHPAVLEAAAVGVPDRLMGEDIAAFAILRRGVNCGERELLLHCETYLGSFKTPSRIHLVSELPKGPSGKVQRLRLVETAEQLGLRSLDTPGTDVPHERLAGEAAALRDIEAKVSDIWSTLLNIPQIDRDSHFFANGGQSVTAIQCLSRMRETIGVSLSIADFFDNPTIAELARLAHARLENAAKNGAHGVEELALAVPPIEPRERREASRLSPSLEGIWFIGQLCPEEPVYNEGEAIRVRGPLDLGLMQVALDGVVERHENLRSTIQVEDGCPLVIVHESLRPELKISSLRDVPRDQREAALANLILAEMRRPFELDVEPSLRAAAIEIDQDDVAIVISLHHMVCDSTSLGILWREIRTLYTCGLKGVASTLPPLRIQYQDYAQWQRQPALQERLKSSLSFWKDKLQGAPLLLDLPADRPRLPAFSYRGDKRPFRIDSDLASRLRRLARQERTSLFTIFTAALNILLHRYTQQEDILVGIPMSERDRPEIEPLIGFLIGTQVLRTNLSGQPDFSELLRRVQRGLAEIQTHRAAQFDQIVATLQPERNPSYTPLFQVMLIWRDYEDQPEIVGLPGLVVERLMTKTMTAKCDLTFFVIDEGDEVYFEIEYSTDLFEAARIERLSGHLLMLLGAVAEDPSQAISAVPLLTPAEQHQLLVEWNEIGADDEYT